MKPDDAPPLVVPYDRAVLALVVSLSYQVQFELHEFVRGDRHVREATAERLLNLARGTLRKREQLGTLRYAVRRDGGGRRWVSLFDVAAEQLDLRINAGKDVK
ncbi:hypothetical protein AWB76_00196 [Caballeronia temeraria]|uniref:Uncharacterized protein n=1 Tax=Caballeronia temeraria TaxID=1777137 RepID=A0A157Z5H8_9BURK|nr:hypothetical protein [Caballeronia temeraria]SAK40673.1 hypothetical protein AWB76_00196 [Caballeronia temeraria]